MGEEIIIELGAAILFGVVCALIANSKGRSSLGWFLLGFFFSCIALIIILCLSNLNEENAKWAHSEAEQRRLREQLRQEQLKSEAYRQHTQARLDAHDEALGLDTKQTPSLSAGAAPAERLEPPVPTYAIPPADKDQGIALDNEAGDFAWHYSDGTRQFGPCTPNQIRQLVSQEKITSGTLMWREGLNDWISAAEIPSLKALLRS